MYTREKQGGHIVGGGVGSLRLCLVVFFEPDKIFRDVSGFLLGFLHYADYGLGTGRVIVCRDYRLFHSDMVLTSCTTTLSSVQ